MSTTAVKGRIPGHTTQRVVQQPSPVKVERELATALTIVQRSQGRPESGRLTAQQILALQRVAGNLAVKDLLCGASPTVQRGKTLTPSSRLTALTKRGIVTTKESFAGTTTVKSRPKHYTNYMKHKHAGRNYFFRSDANKRVAKIAGPLVYTTTKRFPTLKVAAKRKTDASGHLIAHSLGGPPKLTHNYLAMNRFINSAGGDWGKTEAYIRDRCKVKGTKVWMSVYPRYLNKSKRPYEIEVRLKFNKKPQNVRFLIDTP